MRRFKKLSLNLNQKVDKMNESQRIATLETEVAELKKQLTEMKQTASREMDSTIASLNELRATNEILRSDLTKISRSPIFQGQQ
jgi:regulator of replication initiation timing